MIGQAQAMLHSVLVSINDSRQAARGLVIIFRQTEGILGGRGAHAIREPAGSHPAGQEEGKGRVTVLCLIVEQAGSQVSTDEGPYRTTTSDLTMLPVGRLVHSS